MKEMMAYDLISENIKLKSVERKFRRNYLSKVNLEAKAPYEI